MDTTSTPLALITVHSVDTWSGQKNVCDYDVVPMAGLADAVAGWNARIGENYPGQQRITHVTVTENYVEQESR